MIHLLAVRVQFLPEVIDFSLIPDLAGTFGLLGALSGATRGLPLERVARLTMLGNVIGGYAGLFFLLVNLAGQVFS